MASSQESDQCRIFTHLLRNRKSFRKSNRINEHTCCINQSSYSSLNLGARIRHGTNEALDIGMKRSLGRRSGADACAFLIFLLLLDGNHSKIGMLRPS